MNYTHTSVWHFFFIYSPLIVLLFYVYYVYFALLMQIFQYDDNFPPFMHFTCIHFRVQSVRHMQSWNFQFESLMNDTKYHFIAYSHIYWIQLLVVNLSHSPTIYNTSYLWYMNISISFNVVFSYAFPNRNPTYNFRILDFLSGIFPLFIITRNNYSCIMFQSQISLQISPVL